MRLYGARIIGGGNMKYLVSLYDPKNNIFIHEKFMYYTKKQARQRARAMYPGYEIISIERACFH